MRTAFERAVAPAANQVSRRGCCGCGCRSCCCCCCCCHSCRQAHDQRRVRCMARAPRLPRPGPPIPAPACAPEAAAYQRHWSGSLELTKAVTLQPSDVHQPTAQLHGVGVEKCLWRCQWLAQLLVDLTLGHLTLGQAGPGQGAHQGLVLVSQQSNADALFDHHAGQVLPCVWAHRQLYCSALRLWTCATRA